MKKIMFLALIITCSVATYSETMKSNNVNGNNSNYIMEKGKIFMRQPLSEAEEVGNSGSTQNIEYVSGIGEYDNNKGYNGYSVKTKGVVTGTTSRFNVQEDSMWITGVSFGYLDSDVDYDGNNGKEDVETIGLNAYLGYNVDNYLILGYAGGAFGDSDNTGDNNSVTLGVETGKFLFIGEKNTLYPYISLEGIRSFSDDYSYRGIEYDKNIENYVRFNVGLDYRLKFEKYELKLFTKYSDVHNSNDENDIEENGIKREISSIDMYEDGVAVGGSLFYYMDEELYFALDLFKVIEENNDEIITGIRLGHLF